MLESVYEACSAYEIQKQGLKTEVQAVVPVRYQNVFVETGLRLDIWIERSIILECKAVELLNPLYEAQLLTYLKITGCRFGYLVNFNVRHLRDGIKRKVL